jgi:predicted 3-demethylubiquinone-9 3-methyltransferase (glyoxalase superfamily)
MIMTSKEFTTCLWFDTQAEEAATFYCEVFPDSEITARQHYGEAGPGPAGSLMTVDFVLGGQRFLGLNGGPEFAFNESVSFQIHCADQAEVDHYWNTLTEGGQESQCGWCKDRFGVSWQVIPEALPQLLGDPDPGRAQRAMTAMLTMTKLDVDVLRAAADG